MIDWTWIRAAKDAPLMVVLSAIALYVLLILYTRLVGLRSFSKMSGFDFAITIAIGSILASVTLWQKPTLLEGAVALGVLFGLQFVVGNLRKRVPGVTALVDNAPLLLMDGTEVLSDNLRRANMTEADLWAKAPRGERHAAGAGARRRHGADGRRARASRPAGRPGRRRRVACRRAGGTEIAGWARVRNASSAPGVCNPLWRSLAQHPLRP